MRERECVCVLVWERAAQAEVMADDHASSVRPLRVLEFYSGIGGMVRASVSLSVFMCFPFVNLDACKIVLTVVE